MMLHLDFIHPDDAAAAQKGSEHPFCVEKNLNVPVFENAVVHSVAYGHAGVWDNQKALWVHPVNFESDSPPPRKLCG